MEVIMKQVGVFAVLLDALRTPSIQVLVFGTGFLLCMLFVYMGVLIPMDNNLYALLSEVGNAAPWRQALLQDATVLGNLSVLLFVTVSVAMALLFAGEQCKALTFVCAVVIGLAVTFLL
jgi:undecaprenyl-diphosphatase